jgi:trehalose 2-sulfotransferase
VSIGSFSALYDAAYDFPLRDRVPARRYVIATTPRSGSTLFALSLWRTGRLGAPLEYLNLPHLRPLIARLGATSLCDYIERLARVRTSPNGLFATKAFYLHLDRWRQFAAPIDTAFAPDAFIYLKRRDRVAQAVSLSKAMQTLAWTGGTDRRAEPRYVFEHIVKCREYLDWQDAGWDQTLKAAGKPVLDIVCEDFMENRAGVIAAVESFLGVTDDARVAPAIPLTDKQGDGDNEAWRRRFLDDLEAGLERTVDVRGIRARLPSYGGDWSSPFAYASDRAPEAPLASNA